LKIPDALYDAEKNVVQSKKNQIENRENSAHVDNFQGL
jgi:hypothetical protein